jgi:hypothetical protein
MQASFFSYKCDCGEKLWHYETYRAHYALKHLLAKGRFETSSQPTLPPDRANQTREKTGA